MSRTIKKGAADQSVYIEILDSASTTGGRKTGIVYNAAGLTAYYVRNGGAATAITLATLAAANSAHSDGGFKEVDAANAPGIYRLDLPDAAVASGAESVVVTVKGASGAAQVSTEVQLVDNVALDVFSRLGAPAGASVSADVAAVKVVLPAALVSGRMDAHMGSLADAVLTAAKFAAGAFDAVWSVAARVLTAGTNIVLAKNTGVTGFNDIAVGAAMTLTSGERTAIANAVEAEIIDETDSEKVLEAITNKIAAVNPDLSGLTLSAIAAAVWASGTRLLTGGANIVLAKSVGVTGFIDLSAAQVRAEADAAIADAALATAANLALVKAQTDALPSDPADQSLIIAATTAITNAIAALNNLSVAGVRTALGMASANLDNQLADLPTNAELAAADDPVLAQLVLVRGKTDLIPAAPAAVSDIPSAIQNADAVLNRDLSVGTDSGSSTVRTLRQAARFLRNRWVLSGGVLTVYKEDDVTASWTSAVGTDVDAEPVVSSDPAGP